jgi:amino acid adenylation domain-containing protein
VLLLTVHHIAADGWSLAVMLGEIAALYLAASFSDVPQPRIQYADFAVWQRRWLSGDALERQLAYWRDRLRGAPALELPTDRPRPALQSFRGATRSVPLPLGTGRGLHELAREHDATLFMVVLAAFQALLSRYTGQDDVVVGSPIANRNRAEVEPLIGFFVNTLVLRGDLAGDPPFSELVERARQTALGAYGHQDLPFGRLVEELRPERRLSHNPLFQVMVGVQNAPVARVDVPGLSFAAVDFEFPVARFDLEAMVWEDGESLTIQLTWATDLFDAVTIDRLALHLEILLAGLAAEPERRLSELPLLSVSERHQLLHEWNDTAAELPDTTLADLFREQAARRPGAVALSSAAGELTYADLDARSDRLARRLVAAGVGPEVPVAILAERSPAVVMGLLAIVKAGGAYVPLDPTYPAERLAWMLADSGARVLLGEPEQLAALSERGETAETARGLELVDLTGAVGAAGAPDGPGPAGPLPDSLLYVMYTSGSTGRPKGVGVTHRNAVRLLRRSGFADLGPEQVFLLLAPVSFDVSTLEIWGPLANGGHLAIPTAARPSLEDIGEEIAHRGVTTLWLTAGLFHAMVDEELDALGSLRQLLAGGDVLSPAHTRRAVEGLPGCAVINGYGPTEGTTFTACHRVAGVEEAAWTVPIGRPFGNTRAHVLDGAMRPVPVGVWGELYAGGLGVSRGYLGRPDLTAERFVPDPVGVEPGGRLYRTGDLARHRGDGRLEFLGRRDGQVKLRGYRIELGEIESALARHPGVRQAVVTARDDGGPVGRRLVAYLVGSAEIPELRRFLGESLPDYMIPTAWVTLDALPLTPNGKVDRAALPAPERPEGSEVEYVAPSSPLEEALAREAAEILGLERVGMRDNFFDLGGHSLLATQLVSRLVQEHGLDVNLQMMFEARDLAGLADRIVDRQLAEMADLEGEDLEALLRQMETPLETVE